MGPSIKHGLSGWQQVPALLSHPTCPDLRNFDSGSQVLLESIQLAPLLSVCSATPPFQSVCLSPGGRPEQFLSTGLGYRGVDLNSSSTPLLWPSEIHSSEVSLWARAAPPCFFSEERACVWQLDCTASDAVTALVYVGCFRVPEEKLPSSQEHNQHNPLLSHTWLSFLEKPNIWNEMKRCIVFYSFEWRGTELPFIQI